MTELKTLKDFGTNNIGGYSGKSYQDKELRQEAIKWIKALQANLNHWMSDVPLDSLWPYPELQDICDYSEDEQIKLFKKFFNITEEI